VDAGIDTWMSAGIWGWMLRPSGRGLYHQMLSPPLGSGVGYDPGRQLDCNGAQTSQFGKHLRRADSAYS
jgi:hypothetical protein